LAALAALAACERAADTPSPPQAARDVSQPAGWADELAMPAPADLNPDPNVLEIELEARIADVEIVPGTKTPAWTYNGTVPGPMLRAKRGDRVIVHFKNSLPEATTIHWHGLRVPNDMDGAPGVTQPPIESGGEFRYEFTLNDSGTYWYHPHTDSSAQVGRGLYGAFVVDDPEGADTRAFGDELVMLLSDMSLDERGELSPADSGGHFGDLFGREGAVLLVNGKVRPTLKVRNGKQQRWRIINATRARYYNLRLRNHRFVRLGGDNGLAARSEDVYNLILTPGERADAVFTPADPPGRLRQHFQPPVGGDGRDRNRRGWARHARADPGGPACDRAGRRLDGKRAHARPHDRDHVDGRDGRQRRAVLEGRAVRHRARRHGGLADRQRHRFLAPVPFARLLFSSARRRARARMERHRERADEVGAKTGGAIRRSAGRVDVSLPHPRPRRGRHDGPSRRARSERTASRRAAARAPALILGHHENVLGDLDEIAVGIAEVDRA
jgi:FtsP/CotA-like multicopper oxidase with cupredoxin domain